MQGSLGGLVDAAGGEHEIVAFAPTSIRGPERIRAALAGIDVELRTWPLPFSHAVRTAWSRLGRPAAERLARRLRRPALLRLDVPTAARRGARDDDPRPRAAPSPRVDDRDGRGRCTRASTETPPRTCDVVFVNSAYTGRDVSDDARCPGGADPRRASRRRRPSSRPTGRRPTSARRTSSRSRRSSRGRTSRCSSRRSACSANELQLAVVGAEGWGEQPLLDGPGIRRLGYVSDDELARLYRGAAVVAYPSRFEGFGIPVIEAMACGAPVVVVVARVARRGERRRGASAPIPRIRLRSPRRSSMRWPSATGSSRSASSTRERSRGAPSGETFLRGYEEAGG